MNGLTSVFVRLYINLISKDITKLNITISEECGIINAICNQAALLMYKFWDQNVLFFFEMFDIILPKDYGTECFVVKNRYFSEEQFIEKNGTHNVDCESLQQAEKTILLRRIIRKTAEYFFDQSVVLKNDEMWKYSERTMIKIDFLVVKLDEKSSGLMSTKQAFDVVLTVLVENDID